MVSSLLYLIFGVVVCGDEGFVVWKGLYGVLD